MTLVIGLLAVLSAPAVPASAQELEWAAVTDGRMIDVYDVERSDEHLIANGLVMAQLSRAAYGTTATTRADRAADAHYRVVSFVQDGATDTQALVLRDASVAVVAIRGTSSQHDWVVDSAAVVTPLTHRMPTVHVGFAAAATAIRPQIAAVLDTLLASGVREIWVTGHSLGGAVAQLVAWDLETQGFPIGQVVTFGAPPVGKSSWQSTYGSLAARTHRWETHEDVVPCLVPDSNQWPLNGSLHVLPLTGGVALHQSGSRCTNFPNPNPDSVLCSDEVLQWVAIFGFGLFHLVASCSLPDPIQGIWELLVDLEAGRSFDGHSITDYSGRIAALIPRISGLLGF